MQTITGVLTESNYKEALTIDPGPWEEIEVAISDAPVMMQLFENDEHRGGWQGGDWRSEILVDPATLTLGKVGGVRFRTNPDTPGLGGTIFALARAAGDPVIAGLSPRKQLGSIFGPVLFTKDVPIGTLLPAHDVLNSPVPGSWSSLVLRLSTNGISNLHFTVDWSHAGELIQELDFYTANLNLNPALIALPIAGDSVDISCIPAVGNDILTISAYLSNFAPLSLWSFADGLLKHVEADAIAGGTTKPYPLPLFSGTVNYQVSVSGPANQAGNTFEVLALDQAGAIKARPCTFGFTLDAAGVFRTQGQTALGLQRNIMQIHAGVGALTAFVSILQG